MIYTRWPRSISEWKHSAPLSSGQSRLYYPKTLEGSFKSTYKDSLKIIYLMTFRQKVIKTIFLQRSLQSFLIIFLPKSSHNNHPTAWTNNPDKSQKTSNKYSLWVRVSLSSITILTKSLIQNILTAKALKRKQPKIKRRKPLKMTKKIYTIKLKSFSKSLTKSRTNHHRPSTQIWQSRTWKTKAWSSW